MAFRKLKSISRKGSRESLLIRDQKTRMLSPEAKREVKRGVVLKRNLYIMVLGGVLLSGCAPSKSDIEDLVDERISGNSTSFGFTCPTCSAECQRQEFEVVDVGRDEQLCELRALIKFYYSCDVCKRAEKQHNWSKTWFYTLREMSDSFWRSLRQDRILPVRRRPKCLLFKLFSGDFFSQYELAHSYERFSLVERCDKRSERLLNRYRWVGGMIGLFVFLLVEAVKKPVKAKELARRFWVKAEPVVEKACIFCDGFFPLCLDGLMWGVRHWLKILWWLVFFLMLLQLAVRFWVYWNN